MKNKLTKKIGKGTLGEVYCINNLAIKRIKIIGKKKNNKIYEILTILNEINILSSLNHTNILNLINVQLSLSHIDLFTELFDQNLNSYITSNIINLNERKKILYQIFNGVNYLHNNQIIHRDLKPSNIFINNDLRLVIGDFGLSSCWSTFNNLKNYNNFKKNKYYQQFLNKYRDIIDEKSINLNTELWTYVVTRWYRAPELLCNQDYYNSKIDIWSCGCIWGELVKGIPLFCGNDSLNQLNIIIDYFGVNNLISPDCDIQLYLDKQKLQKIKLNFLDLFSCILLDEIEIFQQCLKVDFKERFCSQKVLNSNFS